MHRYEKTVARVIAGCGRPSGRSRIRALADAALSAPMFNFESEGDNPTDTGREEPQDDRPQLVAHDVSDAAGHPLIAFYNPEGATMDGEIIYARATVEARP